MRPEVELLFQEFAASWARGEHPDVRDYLERAGAERDGLATLLDGFLTAAPARPPSEETLAAFAGLAPGEHDTPPMLEMRVAMGLRRRDVVRQLRGALGLGKSDEPKVARYYHELETGLLDPRRVSPRVWHALATLLAPAIRPLMMSNYEAPPVVVTAYFRRADPELASGHDDVVRYSETSPELGRSVESPESTQPDEVDTLFTGGA